MPEKRFDDNAYDKHIERMKTRTKAMALRIIRLFEALPKNDAARILGRQLLRSATSVGANYRAACRVRTAKEFAAKLRIVCEEADETQYWLELLMDASLFPAQKLQPLHTESTELAAIFTKALHTARTRLKERP